MINGADAAGDCAVTASHGNRKPRAYFTEKLVNILSDLDKSNEREYEFNGAYRWEKAKYYWARSRVLAVWVCGSYARGALECGDLDLVVQFESENVQGKATRIPAGRHAKLAFWRGVRNVQFIVGRPEENFSGVKFPDAISVWTRGMDWRAAIKAIPYDTGSGRFPRATDEFPIDFRRIGLDIADALEMGHAHIAGLLRWRFLPFGTTRLTQEILTKKEAHVRMRVEMHRGREAVKVLESTMAILRELKPELAPKKRDWEHNFGESLWWAGFEVMIGHLHGSVDAFENSPRIRGFIVAPFLRAKGPNGLLIIERGDNFPKGLKQYKIDRKARWDALK